jgi:hypothetical protein
MQLLNVIREDRVTIRELWHAKFGLVCTLTCPADELPGVAAAEHCAVILLARSPSRDALPWFCDRYAPPAQEPSNKRKRRKGRAR